MLSSPFKLSINLSAGVVFLPLFMMVLFNDFSIVCSWFAVSDMPVLFASSAQIASFGMSKDKESQIIFSSFSSNDELLALTSSGDNRMWPL